MLKKLLVVLAVALLVGCDSESARMNTLQKEFQIGDITKLPSRRSNQYIVREPDGTIWYVEFRNLWDDSPIDKYILFKPLRKAPS